MLNIAKALLDLISDYLFWAWIFINGFLVDKWGWVEDLDWFKIEVYDVERWKFVAPFLLWGWILSAILYIVISWADDKK